MSHIATVYNKISIVKHAVRSSAPLLLSPRLSFSLLRPFTSSIPSTSSSTDSSTKGTLHHPAPPHTGLSSSSGMKRADRPSIPRTSSHANVKQPTPRAMDINQLNRLEEKEGGRYETPVSRLGQQGDLEADGGADLEVQDGGAHLTFSDVPLKTVLASKRRYGTSLHSVAENESIAAAMELIKSLNIGAVLVHSTNEDGDIVGIISTRDYIEKVSEGVHPTSASVKDFMTESPVFAFDDDLAISCLELMTKHNFRHLPVRERKTGRAIGLVSIGDLVRIMLRQYKESNAYMKDFIHGKYA